MSPFERPIRPSDVGELIDLTVVGDPDTGSMADMQREGVAALYNILCERPFAYLADDVGMGKTYQALALAAIVWNEKPDARLLFLSPRENLQRKWFHDYQRFFAANYRREQGLGDDLVASVLFREPVNRPVLFENLRSWAPTIGMNQRIAPFLRHTSFTRPLYISSRDLDDIGALWHQKEREMQGLGLFNVERPEGILPENASTRLNLAFARALNARLASEAGGGRYFDLVIIDEAQCLRNPENQTNQVLFEALRGRVKKWLFMSATPAHGGPADIPTIINRYPDIGESLSPDLAGDLPALQEALQAFMVRRQRQYRTTCPQVRVGKREYRNHDLHAWGVQDAEMSALGTLAMGLVQKGLVDVLRGRSNRYHIGFLSSFESLQSSLGRTLPTAGDRGEEDNDTPGDWHRDNTGGPTEPDAPDTGFIQRLSEDFEHRFGMALPHPKVDSVVDRVAPLAFGTDELVGGQKFLIFTRRVSTVATLRDRLTARYLAGIEARMRRCWGIELDWSGSSVPLEDIEEDDDPAGFDHEPGDNPFRKAMARKGWLFRYSQTFRAGGRNALFFEDAWLLRLCRAGGVDPRDAAQALPDEIWAESWTHASRSAGHGRRQHKADRMRYIAVQSIRRVPDVFGLDHDRAAPWRAAYEAALHEHLEKASPDADPRRAPELFTAPTLWAAWDERFPTGPLALPVSVPAAVDEHSGRDELCKRQVARTLLGQTFRLTDTLLDVFFADEQARASNEDFAGTFLDWLCSEDPGSRQVRDDCTQWLAHLRLIVDSSLDDASRPWRELAREESWSQLHNLMPVLGVTGGSGAHRTATRQFRTPSLPRVIVCTDTLKEGVDLHLFCDRVLHYGVAWTSGDLEQRVGRVDRFFSQIERRLGTEGTPPAVMLHVGYPHVVSSLERGQVERVIERQRQAELLMDSPLAGKSREERTLVVGALEPRREPVRLEPFRPHDFPEEGHSVVSVPASIASARAEHYERWYEALVHALTSADWAISPGDLKPVRVVTLFAQGRQHQLAWSFDAALERYILTVTGPPCPDESGFIGGARRLIGRGRRVETFTRLLVPTPAEGLDEDAIARLVAALSGASPSQPHDARPFWHPALSAVGNGGVEWLSEHRARAVIARGDRTHEITLDASESGVRIVGIIAAINDLGFRAAWGGHPAPDTVRDWALTATNDLTLGYLDVHERDGLVFGAHTLHGQLTDEARRRLIEEVARRADTWKAALTGADQR